MRHSPVAMVVGRRRAEFHPGRVSLRPEQRAHEHIGPEPSQRVLMRQEQATWANLSNRVERQRLVVDERGRRAAARTCGSLRDRSRISRTTRPGRPPASRRSGRPGRSQPSTSPTTTSRSRSPPGRPARSPRRDRRRRAAGARSGGRVWAPANVVSTDSGSPGDGPPERMSTPLKKQPRIHGVPGRTSCAIATPASVSATRIDSPAASVTGADAPASRNGVIATGWPNSAQATNVSTINSSQTSGLFGLTMPTTIGCSTNRSAPPAAMAARARPSRAFVPLVP